jgi:hypothetical protein
LKAKDTGAVLVVEIARDLEAAISSMAKILALPMATISCP